MKAATIVAALLLSWNITSSPLNAITRPSTNTTRGIHTTAATTLDTSTLTIDTFHDRTRNDLGHWHGAGEDLPVEFGHGYMRLHASDPDHNFHTQLSSSTCANLVSHRAGLLHIVFAGTPHFTVSLTQHNYACDSKRSPYPETWDSVEAGRYAVHHHSDSKNELYIPLTHFHIDLSRVVSVAFHGFFTRTPLTLYKVEVVPADHHHDRIPPKLPSGTLALRCTRPNSIAFGIDDGQPQLAREVMRIVEEEGILVTFFVVGNGLRDPEANFSGVYGEMLRRGHQVALHSNSHPKMEALTELDDIDNEIRGSIAALRGILDVESRYFRPPFGTVGARMRQRLAAHIHDPVIVNWSVDVEDWLWAGTGTPERQMEAFVRDVEKGGNLVVMHYLSPSTVLYFREFIRFAKRAGLDIMRVDQCMQDPASPRFVRGYDYLG